MVNREERDIKGDERVGESGYREEQRWRVREGGGWKGGYREKRNWRGKVERGT